ncbi:hypothetical protein [Halorussus halophilus]|uniref:hypothetical protein n=1 Tax=Halorussus halophilus TaxID=2650975 RepID=UPI001300CBE7|nr:hypothetical protein [Halorussus halophilus]
MSSNTTSRADGKSGTLQVRPTNTVPAGVPVIHYDELPEPAQQLLAEREHGTSITVTPELQSLFPDDSVVVFSEYLRVEAV